MSKRLLWARVDRSNVTLRYFVSRQPRVAYNYLDTSQKYTCGVYVPYNEPKSNARLYYTQYWEREPLAPGTLACRLGVQFE
jgi:hypothetical protein